MAYHKRPVNVRVCAHCRSSFSAAHKSRMYCSSSCNTLAWRARRSLNGAVDGRAGASALSPPPLPAAGAPSLAFTLQNVGVIAAGAAMGQLAVQVGTNVVQELRRPGPAPVAGPAGWLPAEVLATAGTPVLAQLPDGVSRAWLTPLAYRRRLFHFSAALALLFAETTDGTLIPITTEAQLNAVAPPEGIQALIDSFVPGLGTIPIGTDDAMPERLIETI